MSLITTTTTTQGPVFDSSVEGVVGRALTDAERAVGELLVRKVRTRLSQVLVNPTGHYSAKIDYSVLQGTTLVSDSGVVYGPWLEGVSSRNARTRFRGYSTFRRITGEGEADVVAVLEESAQAIVKELS